MSKSDARTLWVVAVSVQFSESALLGTLVAVCPPAETPYGICPPVPPLWDVAPAALAGWLSPQLSSGVREHPVAIKSERASQGVGRFVLDVCPLCTISSATKCVHQTCMLFSGSEHGRIYIVALLFFAGASCHRLATASDPASTRREGGGSPPRRTHGAAGRRTHMHEWESLSHVRWEGKYHGWIIPKASRSRAGVRAGRGGTPRRRRSRRGSQRVAMLPSWPARWLRRARRRITEI